jgi:hypothetical protein
MEMRAPLIFATPSLQLASCYLFRWDDSWVNQSITTQSNNDYQVIMVISDKQKFEKLDKGGSIYLLPVANFTFKEGKSLGIYEWTSRQSVQPIIELRFNSALEAMKKFGVQVYFK